MASIGGVATVRPLIFAVEKLDQSFGKHLFEVSQKDDVVFPMVVDPAVVAGVRIAALRLTSWARVENLVQCVVMNVAQDHI